MGKCLYNKKCEYESDGMCSYSCGYEESYMYSKKTVIEFTKIFIKGLENTSLYPADIYTVKYKRKKYTGTIEEIFDKWFEDVL